MRRCLATLALLVAQLALKRHLMRLKRTVQDVKPLLRTLHGYVHVKGYGVDEFEVRVLLEGPKSVYIGCPGNYICLRR